MAEPAVVTLASLLRQLRIDSGLTQEELASAAGLSTRSISDLERGVTLSARKETARLLADALGLPDDVRATFDAVARGRAVSGTATALSARIGGAASATRTLPRDIASFTGREREFGLLIGGATAASASAGVVSIHAIGGMAGVGKTAFAVRAAHQLASKFPDGQIFLPLHGHTPGQRPVDPSDALASLLLTAGVAAAQIPPDAQARSALWRDHLAGKRVLLVLDDAVGHEQVRPLLPGTAGSLVLITSRRHLTALEDAQAISLDTLPASEAAELLVRLAARPGLGAGDPLVADIARLCGYLPLAIGMLARQLNHHPTWTVAELAAELDAARDRLGLMHAENLSAAAAFDLSYKDLATEQQEFFRRLGLHPGPLIDAFAAAALADTSVEAARRVLDALYDHYLITEPGRGRYQFHDLIRQHAQALVAAEPPAVTTAALGRLLDYYVRAAQGCDVHLARRPYAGEPFVPRGSASVPEPQTRQAAVGWMSAEYGNLYAAAEHAAAHGSHAHAIAIPAAMAGFMRSQGHWSLAITMHQIAVRAARRTGDRRCETAALVDLAQVQFMTRHPDAAQTMSRALELSGQLDDQLGQANSLVLAAEYHEEDYPAATASLTRALELYRRAGSGLGEANALCELGTTQSKTSDFGAARASLERALAQFREVGEPFGEANSLNDLGNVLSMSGETADAIARHVEALELFRSLGSRHGEANALGDLAAVQQDTGDYAAALDNYFRQLELFEALGNPLWEANALNGLGSVQFDTGNLSAAMTSLGRALDLYQGIGAKLGEANALSNIGEVQLQAGDYEAAGANLRQALAVYRSLGMPDGEASALNDLGELALARSDPAGACEQFEMARDISADIAMPLPQARAMEGIGRCLSQTGDADRGMASLLEALAIYERIGSPRAERVRRMIGADTAPTRAGSRNAG